MEKCFHGLIDLVDAVVLPAFEHAFADGVDDIRLGDAAQPEDGVSGVGGFEVNVHQLEYLEQEGFGDGVVFDAEEFDHVDLLKEEAFGYSDILRCNEIYNPADSYIAVYAKYHGEQAEPHKSREITVCQPGKGQGTNDCWQDFEKCKDRGWFKPDVC
jgi:hypothetical protein